MTAPDTSQSPVNDPSSPMSPWHREGGSRPRQTGGAAETVAEAAGESSLEDSRWAGGTAPSSAPGVPGEGAGAAESYGSLKPEAARLFRLLAVHPGAEFGAPVAAALAGVSIGGALHLMDVLVAAGLLNRAATDRRYILPDGLRAYAAGQAAEQENPDTSDERPASLRRVLSWYLHTANAARTLIDPDELPITALDPLPDGVTPLAFANHDTAMRWCEEEHANLMAATRAADGGGLGVIAWQLPAVLTAVHARTNTFETWLAAYEIGLRAARRDGDRAGEAEMLRSMGMAGVQSHRLSHAAACHEGDLALRRELGDRPGEARALNALGTVQLRGRQLAAAHVHFTAALDLYRQTGAGDQWEPAVLADLAAVSLAAGRSDEGVDRIVRAIEGHRQRGDQRGEAAAVIILAALQRQRGDIHDALRTARSALDIAQHLRSRRLEGLSSLELGMCQGEAGLLPDALASFYRSAVLQRQAGDRLREALAWNGTGQTYTRLGRYVEAADFHRHAAATQRELDDPWQLALTLDGLATALHHNEQHHEARTSWTEALHLITPYDDPCANGMRLRISSALESSGCG